MHYNCDCNVLEYKPDQEREGGGAGGLYAIGIINTPIYKDRHAG